MSWRALIAFMAGAVMVATNDGLKQHGGGMGPVAFSIIGAILLACCDKMGHRLDNEEYKRKLQGRNPWWAIHRDRS